MTGPPMAGFPRTVFLRPLAAGRANVEAGAVKSRDLPTDAVVAGNPAREVRCRFDDATVARLLASAGWHWPVEKITRNLNAIRGADRAALEAAR